MAQSDDMPRVDFTKDGENLKAAQSYAKYIEAKNFARAVRAKKILIRNRIISGVCWALVIGIYGSTFVQMKEEKFLDDFEEPPRQIKN